MNSYRNFVKNNAGLYSIMLQKYESSADLDDLKSDFIHVISLILKPYNLGSKDEVHVIRGLRSFIHGFTDLEIKGGFQMNVDVDTSFAKFADVLISSIEEI
jgi:hypothetical protein